MINSSFIQFHKLPLEIKRAVTSPQAMKTLDDLEKRFHVGLADLLVRLMVKEVALADLPDELMRAHGLPPPAARELSDALQAGLLLPVLAYLQPTAPPQPKPVPPPPPRPTPAPVSPPPKLATTVPEPVHLMTKPQQPSPAATAPRVGSVGKAAYYVSAEDEQEIAKHRDRLQRISTISPTVHLEDHIETVLRAAAPGQLDSDLTERLRGVLRSRLRDVRTTDEFRELLARPISDGGMGFDPVAVARMADAADALARSIHDREAAGHFAEPRLVRPVAPTPTTLVSTPAPAPAATAVPARPQPPVVAAPPPPPPRPTAPPVPVQPRQPVRRNPSQMMDRRVIQDIKRPAQQPVGLTDELGLLTIDDFRSLGSDLRESAEKIVEKVQLLADESYEQRATGIAAWRRSEIHQLYLAMGRESLAGNRTIEEVVNDRRRRNQPYLTAAEFAAIADLNHQLIA